MFLQQIDHNIKRLLSLSADVLVQVDYTTPSCTKLRLRFPIS